MSVIRFRRILGRSLPFTVLLAAVAAPHTARAQSVPAYLQQIVEQNAPIIIEETDGAFQPNERSVNHLMRIDFDGDVVGGNNVADANNSYYPNPAPVIYYSVTETTDAYYIGYYFYHIQDGGTQAYFNKPGHEHDLEGIWEVVQKNLMYPFGVNTHADTSSRRHAAIL